MKIITARHVNMEDKVFNPYRRICGSITYFDIHGFQPFWEFRFQYFISEAEGVCGASISGQVATYFGCGPSVIFGLDITMLAMFGSIAVIARRGMPPFSIDRSSLTCFILQALPEIICVSLSSFVSVFTVRWYRMVFGLGCRFVPTTWWSVSRIARRWYGLQHLLIRLQRIYNF